MSLIELIHKEDNFQQHLLSPDHYTVIAPADFETFMAFVKLANDNIEGFTIHQVLKDKAGIRKLLGTLNPNIELSLHVVDGSEESTISKSFSDEYLQSHTSGFL